MKLNGMQVTKLVAGAVMSASLSFGAVEAPSAEEANLVRKVRKEILMLPYYGVFDSISYRVDGDTVTLLGQVTRPTLKSDAGRVVKRIEGVALVRNEIEVLPLYSFEDRIRIAFARAVYGQSARIRN